MSPKSDVLSRFTDIVGVAAYVAQDLYHHVVVATKDGALYEVYFKPAQGVHQPDGPLTRLNGITAIAGYPTNDGKQHVIVATKDGGLTEIWWKPAGGVNQIPFAQRFTNIVGVAGFQGWDNKEHVIVGANDRVNGGGNLYEITWDRGAGPESRQFRPLKASNSGPPNPIVAVSACLNALFTITIVGNPASGPLGPGELPDLPNDALPITSILLATTDGSVQQYKYQGANTEPFARPIGQFTDVAGVCNSGLFSRGNIIDEYIRGVVATKDGKLAVYTWTEYIGDQMPHPVFSYPLPSKIVAIAGYYSGVPGGDGNTHAFVGCEDGTLNEVYWAPGSDGQAN